MCTLVVTNREARTDVLDYVAYRLRLEYVGDGNSMGSASGQDPSSPTEYRLRRHETEGAERGCSERHLCKLNFNNFLCLCAEPRQQVRPSFDNWAISKRSNRSVHAEISFKKRLR